MLTRYVACGWYVTWASCLAVGQVWIEQGDAPDGPLAGFQVTDGTGTLTSIQGSLNRSAGDHVDTYGFRITDRLSFYASTSSLLSGSTGSAQLDTRMWLWRTDGTLLLGNDDDSGAGDFSTTLSDPSEFGALTGGLISGTALGVELNPGFYLLSISAFGSIVTNNPEDAANVNLADLSAGGFTSLVGRDPLAGAFDHWENQFDDAVGDYVIAFRGAEFATPDCPGGDFDDDGDYDTHDLDFLTVGIVQGVNDPCLDLNGDGAIDVLDRDVWLQEAGAVNLGPGRVYLIGDANLDGSVDGSDFGLWNGNRFTENAAWSAGDFNTDGSIDGSDFGLWNQNRFLTAANATTVPEMQSTLAVALIATWCLSRDRRARAC